MNGGNSFYMKERTTERILKVHCLCEIQLKVAFPEVCKKIIYMYNNV